MITVIRKTIAWLGGHELGVLLAALALVGLTWGFVELADDVTEGDTQQFDERAITALRRADDPATPVGPRWLHEMGRDMTALGGVAVVSLVTLGVVGYLGISRMYHAMWLVVGATGGAIVLSIALKSLFDRPRPQLVPHLSIVHTTSFPSGHSMMSAAVYLTLGWLLARLFKSRVLRVYFITMAVVLTVLVGVSRVYMGVHYPTDVLAGWVAGLTWALLCWLVARQLQRRGVVERDVDEAATDGFEYEVKS